MKLTQVFKNNVNNLIPNMYTSFCFCKVKYSFKNVNTTKLNTHK